MRHPRLPALRFVRRGVRLKQKTENRKQKAKAEPSMSFRFYAFMRLCFMRLRCYQTGGFLIGSIAPFDVIGEF
jgi:hypothetical protein